MKKVYSKDYVAEELGHGLMKMFVAIGTSHAVEEVELDLTDPSEPRSWRQSLWADGYALIGGWGDSIRDIEGSMLLSDGRIITCITAKTGGDTFHSGELSTKFYLLTPKKS